MDINLTITYKLSPVVDDALGKAVAALLAQTVTDPTPTETPKRGKKAAAEAPAAPAAPVVAPSAGGGKTDLVCGLPATVAPIVAAAPAPAAPVAPATTALTLADISAIVTQAMPKLGVDNMRAIFVKTGTTRLTELSVDKYPVLAAEIRAALALAGGA